MQRSGKRWHLAQDYEKNHWEKIAQKIVDGLHPQLDWYEWKADRLKEKLNAFNHTVDLKDATIVEIGSGPIGIVSGLDVGYRYAVEPLGDYFDANPVLTKLRKPEVTYITARGEKLPFDDHSSRLVIIDNVLDHTEKPNLILEEARRVLQDDGLVYIGVNIRSTWGTFLHRIINLFNIDTGHPHEYDHASIRKFLFHNGLKITWETIENRKKIKKINLKQKGLKGRAKVISGLTEFYYEAFCHKRGYPGNAEMDS